MEIQTTSLKENALSRDCGRYCFPRVSSNTAILICQSVSLIPIKIPIVTLTQSKFQTIVYGTINKMYCS